MSSHLSRMPHVPPRILIPLALALVFVVGVFFGNLGSFTSSNYRIFVEESAADLISNRNLVRRKVTVNPRDFEDTTDEYGRILVDISAPIPTLPSMTVVQSRIIHEPPSCTSIEKTGNPVKFTFVIFIFSHAQQRERRKAMRETWGSLVREKCGIRLIFVIGLQNETPGIEQEVKDNQDQIDSESEKHRDILQFGHFIDNSKSPTYKAQLTFEWSLRECPTAEYTLKGEDHVWLNLPDFAKWVKEQKPESIFGHRVYGGSPVFRDPQSFFYVSRDEYEEETYPEYMTNIMFAIPQPILKTLMDQSVNVKKIPLEDVYYTGLVANYAKIPRLNTEGFEYDYLIDKNKKTACPKKDLLAVRYMPPTEMYRYWEDKCHLPMAKPCFVNSTSGAP